MATTPDPLAPDDEEFERKEPTLPYTPPGQKAPRKKPTTYRQPSDGEGYLNVLVPSEFTVSGTGEVGTEWTVVGRAFKTEKGWRIVLKQNLIVTGTLMLMPPRDDHP
jgi:hypothetical protein